MHEVQNETIASGNTHDPCHIFSGPFIAFEDAYGSTNGFDIKLIILKDK